jgi:Uma2 family endonuclease
MASKVLNPELPVSNVAQGLDVASMWKFSVEQYQQMIANGTISEDAPVELLEGWIVTKMPKHPPHIYATEESAELLREILPKGYFVRRQDPITTTDSQPEPDVSVIKGSRQNFKSRLPNLSDIALVIEVADSTLKRDRTVKQRIYASASIPVYWILNLQDRVLEVYTNPVADEKRYAERTDHDEKALLPLVIDGKEIAQLAIKDLLP